MTFPHPQFIVKREGWCQHMVYAAYERFTPISGGSLDHERELVPICVVSGPFLTRGIALRVADGYPAAMARRAPDRHQRRQRGVPTHPR